MQNARIGKTTPVGIKHTGTITLSDGTSFSRKDFIRDPAKIMAGIIQQQRTLFAKEIENWILARAAAESPLNPMRAMLYDIYSDVMIDAVLTGLIYNHRILPVKNKLFAIKGSDDKINPVKTKLLAKKPWLRDWMRFALESIFYGFSLPYFSQQQYDGKTAWIKKVELIPRKHVISERHVYTIYQSDLNGIDYTVSPVADYVTPIGDEYDLGLLNKATPLAILKKHGWQNWDQFAEKFGLPIITVKTASQDSRVQDEIEEWLQTLSTGAYGIFPMDTEMDIKENQKTDAFQVFAQIIDKANTELAILICGQTMTSMNGSSKSQGEVHERVMDGITQDDEIFIENAFNEQVMPLLINVFKYPFDEGDYFEFCQPEDLQALLKIFQGVTQMGFQIDPKQVEEKFGTKIIGLKAVAPPAPGDDPAPGYEQPADDDEQEQETPDKPDDNEKPKEGKKKPASKKPGDKELTAKDLIQLHAKIIDTFGGNHVH